MCCLEKKHCKRADTDMWTVQGLAGCGQCELGERRAVLVWDARPLWLRTGRRETTSGGAARQVLVWVKSPG